MLNQVKSSINQSNQSNQSDQDSNHLTDEQRELDDAELMAVVGGRRRPRGKIRKKDNTSLEENIDTSIRVPGPLEGVLGGLE